ncbi:DinB family protein [Phaeacidiphilus oryzae]|uniref:DinB family protein n=1 Tax=Phaeacidiphilus oryzae TaxID=348818 RepID=UPI00055F50E4|nr:DinB family protein [Phaeacidiphilus oryzae]
MADPELPPRLVPLLEQYDFARERLVRRLAGPTVDSGNGVPVAVPPITDEEYLWEPVPDCLSLRRRASGPGAAATGLVGAGVWGRDTAPPDPAGAPPFTTIAWRLAHLSEMLAVRADHTAGSRTATRDDYTFHGDAAGGLAAFDAASAAWRRALLAVDEKSLDTIGVSSYPYGSDPEDPFLTIVWWVNQELLHHAAEIALLRDLYRALSAARRS